MSKLQQLKAANNLSDVARLLSIAPRNLSYLIYKQGDHLKYSDFTIPKRSGGVRLISAPLGGLKILQRRLADLLQDCLDEINDSTNFVTPERSFGYANHGFARKLSIRTNARNHRNRRYVFNIDLKDFFPSIHFGRVRGFFIHDRSFQLNPNVATVLAQTACYRNSLPQGSPCSPVLSNLIGNILDVHLSRLAKKNGCFYTRYVDDITFSTSKSIFPPSIAVFNQSNKSWLPGPELLRLVSRSGFQINPKKTRMQYNFSRQEVTGLVVNEKVNIKCEYRRRVRAMAHHLFKKGTIYTKGYVEDAGGTFTHGCVPASITQLHGMLGFIDAIDRFNLMFLPDQLAESDSYSEMIKNKEKVYRRFLFFKEFYAATRPVVLCEGWTDYVYIECALRHYKHRYNSLVSLHEGDKLGFAFKSFKTSGTRTGEILGIRGGTGDLKYNLVDIYEKECRYYSVHGMKHPIIVILDNDKAGRAILNLVNNRFSTKNVATDSFIHVCRNLYLIYVPTVDPKLDMTIEKLFAKETLDTIINGKRFDPSSEAVTPQTYSKAVFARQVVEKQANTIDFSGFLPLLDRMTMVLSEHYRKL